MVLVTIFTSENGWIRPSNVMLIRFVVQIFWLSFWLTVFKINKFVDQFLQIQSFEYQNFAVGNVKCTVLVHFNTRSTLFSL